MSSIFPFAPWEWALPISDSQNSEITRSNGYLFTSSPHRNWIFFRAIDSEHEGNFVVTCFDRRDEPSPPNPGIREVRRFSPSEELDCAIREKRVGRVFFLDEHESLRANEAPAHYLVVVSAQGWGQWNRVQTLPQANSRFWPHRGSEFLWSDELDLANFLSIPARELWAQIERQRDEPNSDCTFAHRTSNWTSDDWNNFLFSWKKGTHTELQQVLKAALLSQTNLWEQTTGYIWLIDLDNLHTSWHRGRLAPLDRPVVLKNSPLAPGMLREVLCRVAPYFEPAFDEELVASHLASIHWASSSPMFNWEHYNMARPMRIRVENPTAHERLEAALFWREWQESHPPVI